jgi:hypothetical protein
MSCDDDLVRWTDNDNDPVEPPANKDEWCDVVNSIHRALEVQFVQVRPGRWRVAKAYMPRPLEPGPGPIETSPIEVQDELRAKLKARGFPVD